MVSILVIGCQVADSQAFLHLQPRMKILIIHAKGISGVRGTYVHALIGRQGTACWSPYLAEWGGGTCSKWCELRTVSDCGSDVAEYSLEVLSYVRTRHTINELPRSWCRVVLLPSCGIWTQMVNLMSYKNIYHRSN